jgi:CRP-like cAMP-binding protein
MSSILQQRVKEMTADENTKNLQPK